MPSFGGGARFIPEKYRQSIVEIYTFLILKKEDSDINPLSSAYTHLLSYRFQLNVNRHHLIRLLTVTANGEDRNRNARQLGYALHITTRVIRQVFQCFHIGDIFAPAWQLFIYRFAFRDQLQACRVMLDDLAAQLVAGTNFDRFKARQHIKRVKDKPVIPLTRRA